MLMIFLLISLDNFIKEEDLIIFIKNIESLNYSLIKIEILWKYFSEWKYLSNSKIIIYSLD